MTKAELRQEVLDLPTYDKLELVEVVMGSISLEEIPLPDWQRRELCARLAQYGDEEGQRWEEVRAEIWPPNE